MSGGIRAQAALWQYSAPGAWNDADMLVLGRTLRGMSREDFVHKMKLAMKELAETRCWLRILGASGYIDAKRLEPLVEESRELSRMMGASVSTARSRMEAKVE